MAAAVQQAQQESQEPSLKDTESLASSILSLKPSSTFSSVSNDLKNLSIETNNNLDNEQLKKELESNSTPKIITESESEPILKPTDLENNNTSTTNLNTINNAKNLSASTNNIPNNNSSSSLSVEPSNKSHSRSPSPCRQKAKSPNPSKDELPDHGVRLVHGYHLTEVCENAVGNELMSKLVNDWKQLSMDELTRLTQNIRFKYGYEYTSIIIEPG